MKSTLFNLALIFLSTLIVTKLLGKDIEQKEIKQLSDSYFLLIDKSNFEDASKLFHYPPNYNDDKLRSDINAVSKMLRLFSSEFGKITMIDTVANSIKTTHVSIGGGDLPYWSKHPFSYSVSYPVMFEKEGFGIVKISYCKIKDKWEIREVFYGLPNERENVETWVKGIMMKMFQILQKIKVEENSKDI